MRTHFALKLSLMAALFSTSMLALAEQPGQMDTNHGRDSTRLVTRPPYPAGRADSVNRPGFNGRLWVTTPIIGDPEGKLTPTYPESWGDPGPEGYGAMDDAGGAVYARMGQNTVAINPWERINQGGYHRLEAARHQWLAERNYTGGVRTFVNEVYELLPEAKMSRNEIAPRATIELPPDMPRLKAHQQVRHAAPKPDSIIVVRAKDEPAVTPTSAATRVTIAPHAAPEVEHSEQGNAQQLSANETMRASR